jgi:hypothetical protein
MADAMHELTMIGVPEKILRYAAAGVLIEEGEVSKELAMAVADGTFRLDHFPKIDGRVMHAIRKVASVILTLRSNNMLVLPTQQEKPE